LKNKLAFGLMAIGQRGGQEINLCFIFRSRRPCIDWPA
jgi:hypothetical protein